MTTVQAQDAETIQAITPVGDRVGPQAVPFYSDLADLGSAFCRADLNYLVTV